MYKVAILGCENSHANQFLKAVLNENLVSDIEFVGVYSHEPEAAAKLNELFGVPVAQSYDEFVGKVDGIIVTARHGDNHYKYAKPYLDSGIPVFIDKPITCTEEDAKAYTHTAAADNTPSAPEAGSTTTETTGSDNGAAQTADMAAVAVLASVLALGTAVVVSKKRR